MFKRIQAVPRVAASVVAVAAKGVRNAGVTVKGAGPNAAQKAASHVGHRRGHSVSAQVAQELLEQQARDREAVRA